MKFDNYSKTPWVECLDQVLDSDGFAILRATENLLDKTQHRANVQRIVACVNACKGISTDNLIDNVPLKEGLSGLNQRLRDAESHRDELLAALEMHESFWALREAELGALSPEAAMVRDIGLRAIQNQKAVPHDN